MRFAQPLLIGFFAIALGGCDVPTKPLDSHELQIAAQQVASYAGEGEWLAQQLRNGSITANMAWVHQRALGEDAAKVSRELATKSTPEALRATHDKLLQLNERLQANVTRVAPADGKADELDALQREFHAIAAEAQLMGQAS
jgi:hypothetical protein